MAFWLPAKSDRTVTFAKKVTFLFPQLMRAGVVKGCNMKTTTSMRTRASRFITDRYAYRERPNYFAELAAFGIIVIIASWPILSLANAIATMR